MKFLTPILMVLFAGGVVLAQKAPEQKTVHGARSNHAGYKSTDSSVVAAALKKNSSTAGQLAQVERQNRVHSGRTSANKSANAALPKTSGASTGKNRPIRASHKAPKSAGKARKVH